MRTTTTHFRSVGNSVQCRVTLADGRRFIGTAPLRAAAQPELGWFGSKAVRKVHNLTHKGPIEKAHKAVQRTVGKYLPITKPFIKIHNSLASPVHKLIEGKKIRAKVTARAIADVTKSLPPAQRAKARKILALKAVATENAKGVAAQAALAQAVSKAKAAMRGVPGVYKVVRPDGRIVNVPAAKVRR